MEGDDWGVRRKQGSLAGQTTHNAVLFAEERPISTIRQWLKDLLNPRHHYAVAYAWTSKLSCKKRPSYHKRTASKRLVQ
jgi:hypothetical protein